MQRLADLQIRPLREEDLDAAMQVRDLSFGPLSESMRSWWQALSRGLIAQDRAIAVLDGERIVAHAKTRPFRQVWGGRLVPMGGVAGVVVDPEYRGRGVATAMVVAAAKQGMEHGDLVSALYPTTLAPYRRAGWEVAGTQTRVTVPGDALRRLRGGEARVRRGTGRDAAGLVALIEERRAGERACGDLVPTAAALAAEILDEADAITYVSVDEDGGYDGYVVYGWADHELTVYAFEARTPEATRALWCLVGSGASVTKRVHVYVRDTDVLPYVLDEESGRDTAVKTWMLRVLDVRGAFESRGYPAGSSGEISFVLDDPLVDEVSGLWQIAVADGTATATHLGADTGQAPAPTLRLGPRGLAALYAGAPLGTLRAAGLVSGTPGLAQEQTVADLLRCPSPTMREYF